MTPVRVVRQRATVRAAGAVGRIGPIGRVGPPGPGGGISEAEVDAIVAAAIATEKARAEAAEKALAEAGGGALTWHTLPLAEAEPFGAPYQAPEYAWNADHISFRGLLKAPAIHSGQVIAHLAAEAAPTHKRAFQIGGANGREERCLAVIENDGTFKIIDFSALAENGLLDLDPLIVAK